MLNYKKISLVRLLGIAVITITVLITVILQIAGVINILADLTSIWIWIAAATLGFGGGLLVRSKDKKKLPLETENIPDFKRSKEFLHLAVYYCQIPQLPNTPICAQTRYIANSKTQVAYYMRELPDWFKNEITDHEIRWRPYSDERQLIRCIKAEYTVADEATYPSNENLGLVLYDGKWIEDRSNSDLLTALKGKHLEQLRIYKLERRYFFSIKRRVILADFSEKKAWLAPPYYYDLTLNQIINDEPRQMYFWEHCENWTKRFLHFEKLEQRSFPESRLLTLAKINADSER